MNKLCEVYNYAVVRGAVCAEENPLPEIGFKLEKVQANIRLTSGGEFYDFDMIPKEKQDNIPVPATPDSIMARGAPVSPHPIFDKVKELGTDTQLSILSDWCECDDVPDDVRIIYSYLKKRCLREDLKNASVRKGIKVDTESLFVVFKVFSNLPFDEQFIESWKKHFTRLCEHLETGTCYVSGEKTTLARKHPFASGTAMLISMNNDNCMGRFGTDAKSALSIGLETSLKVHSARRWLMKRQGRYLFGMEFVAFDTCNFDVPAPLEPDEDEIDTGELDAEKMGQASEGIWSKRISEIDSYTPAKLSTVAVMIVDSATGKGRAAVTYYNEFNPKQYIQHLLNWYRGCVWMRFNSKAKRCERFTPSLYTICNMIYGDKNVESIKKLKKQLCKELIPCIIESRPIPVSIISSGFSKVINPLSFKNGVSGKWNRNSWFHTVGTLCALLHKKDQEKGNKTEMMLDENEKNRDYLFGRLLALADMVEQSAMKKSDNKRETNAIRYMQRFSMRPSETWQMLRTERLNPYMNRLEPGLQMYYQRLICDVESKLSADDYTSKKPLGPRFLQGYSCQKTYKKAADNDQSTDEN